MHPPAWGHLRPAPDARLQLAGGWPPVSSALAALIDHLQQILGFDEAGWREEGVVQYQQTNSGELP